MENPSGFDSPVGPHGERDPGADLPEAPVDRPRPRRLYTKALGGILAFVAVVHGAMLLFGFVGLDVTGMLGIGALLIGLGAAFWEVVERTPLREGQVPSLGVWVSLPLALLCGFGSLPFLAVSVYPELEQKLKSVGQVEAAVAEREGKVVLSLHFPRRMLPQGVNLMFGNVGVPESYVKAQRERFQWTSRRRLLVDLRPVMVDLQIAEFDHLRINTLPIEGRFRDEEGQRLSPQTIQLPVLRLAELGR